jgi:hypothetical protein
LELARCPDVVARAAEYANGTRRFAEIRLPFSRLPIGFECDNCHDHEAVDGATLPENNWMLEWQVPGESLARDNAAVARLHDKVPRAPFIILAVIWEKEPRLQARSFPIRRTWMQC